MKNMSKFCDDLGFDNDFKILRGKNLKCILKVRNGNGSFGVFIRENGYVKNRLKFSQKEKFKVFKKFMQIMKIDLAIISKKKLSNKEINIILLRILSVVQNKNLHLQPKIKKRNYPTQSKFFNSIKLVNYFI